MHQRPITRGIGLMNKTILIKSLTENKLHQTPSNSIFFFCSILIKKESEMRQNLSLMDFDEIFDALAPANITLNYENSYSIQEMIINIDSQ